MPRCRQIKLCQRHSVAVLSVPSNSCRRLSIFLPHISPRGSWDGRVEAGVDYRWILHRSARPAACHQPSPTVNDHQLHHRPSNDQQRPATTHPNQRLPSTHHDHESRSLSSIITKPTHSSSLRPRQNSHKDVDYSGWQRHSPATNHAGTYRVSAPNVPIYYAMSYEASAQCTGSGNY